MKDEASNMLKHNCPGCKEALSDWPELKQHVKKVHGSNLCDLCIQHKKIFPYEHTLYTNSQLTKHYKEGDKSFNEDDESGFTGHPECAFCKTRFYGDDELFIHCRDMHEQCFLCVRNGKRHEYYVNYESLEEHFKSDHSLCLHPQCLEKKFIVFDSSIDLKAHEVEVHGEPTVGLQRSMQTENRRLELNFQYDTYRDRRQQQRGNNSNNNSNSNNTHSNKPSSKPNTSGSATTSSSSGPTAAVLLNAEFPAINGSSSKAKDAPKSRIVPGATSKKGKGKQNAIQKPLGFGSLSAVNSTIPDGGSSSSSNGQPESIVAKHATFLSKLESMLQSQNKVSEFRTLTGSYRKNKISGDDYVKKIIALTDNNVDTCSKIFRGVEDLLDIEEKKWELIRIWRNKQTEISQFPALKTKNKPLAKPSSQVLVIKRSKKPQHVVGKTANVWDKVASAASVAKNTNKATNSGGISSSNSSRPSSAQNSARTSPQSSRPASPGVTFRAASSTAWGGSTEGSGSNKSKKGKENFPMLKGQAFPSLPPAAPKHEMILNMRRTASGNKINSPWGTTNQESEVDSSTDNSESTGNNRKKKGRQNKVLFRVGL
ncbi:hypothetical protein K501DRAFT_329335 [Backusella circina FSU 941]|nr:hypothetical protein K501DRAFT_329335 [Backusella circina FSU 941]